MNEELLEKLWQGLGGEQVGSLESFQEQFSQNEDLRRSSWEMLGGDKVGSFDSFEQQALGETKPQQPEETLPPESIFEGTEYSSIDEVQSRLENIQTELAPKESVLGSLGFTGLGSLEEYAPEKAQQLKEEKESLEGLLEMYEDRAKKDKRVRYPENFETIDDYLTAVDKVGKDYGDIEGTPKKEAEGLSEQAETYEGNSWFSPLRKFVSGIGVASPLRKKEAAFVSDIEEDAKPQELRKQSDLVKLNTYGAALLDSYKTTEKELKESYGKENYTAFQKILNHVNKTQQSLVDPETGAISLPKELRQKLPKDYDIRKVQQLFKDPRLSKMQKINQKHREVSEQYQGLDEKYPLAKVVTDLAKSKQEATNELYKDSNFAGKAMMTVATVLSEAPREVFEDFLDTAVSLYGAVNPEISRAYMLGKGMEKVPKLNDFTTSKQKRPIREKTVPYKGYIVGVDDSGKLQALYDEQGYAVDVPNQEFIESFEESGRGENAEKGINWGSVAYNGLRTARDVGITMGYTKAASKLLGVSGEAAITPGIMFQYQNDFVEEGVQAGLDFRSAYGVGILRGLKEGLISRLNPLEAGKFNSYLNRGVNRSNVESLSKAVSKSSKNKNAVFTLVSQLGGEYVEEYVAEKLDVEFLDFIDANVSGVEHDAEFDPIEVGLMAIAGTLAPATVGTLANYNSIESDDFYKESIYKAATQFENYQKVLGDLERREQISPEDAEFQLNRIKRIKDNYEEYLKEGSPLTEGQKMDLVNAADRVFILESKLAKLPNTDNDLAKESEAKLEQAKGDVETIIFAKESGELKELEEYHKENGTYKGFYGGDVTDTQTEGGTETEETQEPEGETDINQEQEEQPGTFVRRDIGDGESVILEEKDGKLTPINEENVPEGAEIVGETELTTEQETTEEDTADEVETESTVDEGDIDLGDLGDLGGMVPEYGKTGPSKKVTDEDMDQVAPKVDSEVKQEVKEDIKKSVESKSVATVPTDDISVDAGRFQFKEVADTKKGINKKLSGRKWKPENAGVITVWKDPSDGNTYVVNGHHRLALAQEQGVDNINVFYLDAENASEARVKGAMQNIAEGQGTAIDAAKVIREQDLGIEDLKESGLALSDVKAKEGLALSKLEDNVFQAVVAGDLKKNVGVIIGEEVDNPDLQLELFKAIQGKNYTQGQIRVMAQDISNMKTEKKTSVNLFGETETEQADFENRSKFISNVRGLISRAKNLLGKTSSSKEFLEQYGNEIDAERSKGASEEAAQALAFFDAYRNSFSEISNILNKGYERIKNGEKRSKVESETANELIENLEGIIEKYMAQGVGTSVSSSSDQQSDGRVEEQVKETQTEEEVEEVTPEPAKTPEQSVDPNGLFNQKAKKQTTGKTEKGDVAETKIESNESEVEKESRKENQEVEVDERPVLTEFGADVAFEYGDSIPDGHKEQLRPHQRKGVNSIVGAFDAGKKAFLLADGAGAGKTRQLLSAAKALSDKGQKVLIVTTSKEVIAGSFQKDAKALGLDFNMKGSQGGFGNVEIVTVYKFRGMDNINSYDSLLFDESQDASGLISKTGQTLSKFKGFTVFSSATPFDTVDKTVYILPKLLGITEKEYLDRIKAKRFKRPGRGEEILLEETEALIDLLNNLHETLLKDGKMLHRRVEFFGQDNLEFVLDGSDTVNNELDIKAAEEGINNYYANKVKRAKLTAYDKKKGKSLDDKRRELNERKRNELRTLNETYKVTPQLLDKLEKDISEGRQVVVYGRNISDSLKFHFAEEGGDSSREYTRPSFIYQIKKGLESRGISFEEVTGANKKKDATVDKFQNGELKVVVVNQSGTTGINLNDVVGNAPRTMYIGGTPPNAIQLEQLKGRISRINNASKANIVYLRTNSDAEMVSRDKTSDKIAIMNSVLQGQEITELKSVSISAAPKNKKVDLSDAGEGVNVKAVNYSAKSIAIFGDTYPIKDAIQEIGGTFNKWLTNPETKKKEPGYIFPKSAAEEVNNFIEALQEESNAKADIEESNTKSTTSKLNIPQNPLDRVDKTYVSKDKNVRKILERLKGSAKFDIKNNDLRTAEYYFDRGGVYLQSPFESMDQIPSELKPYVTPIQKEVTKKGVFKNTKELQTVGFKISIPVDEVFDKLYGKKIEGVLSPRTFGFAYVDETPGYRENTSSQIVTPEASNLITKEEYRKSLETIVYRDEKSLRDKHAFYFLASDTSNRPRFISFYLDESIRLSDGMVSQIKNYLDNYLSDKLISSKKYRDPVVKRGKLTGEKPYTELIQGIDEIISKNTPASSQTEQSKSVKQQEGSKKEPGKSPEESNVDTDSNSLQDDLLKSKAGNELGKLSNPKGEDSAIQEGLFTQEQFNTRDRNAEGEKVTDKTSLPKTRIGRIINAILPTAKAAGFNVIVHNSPDSMMNAIAQANGGRLDSVGGFVLGRNIHVYTGEGVKDNTPIHEVFHPVIAQIIRDNPEVFQQLVDSIQRSRSKSALDARVFMQQYVKEGNAVALQEMVVEALASEALVSLEEAMAEYANQNRSGFKRILNKLLELLGIRKPQRDVLLKELVQDGSDYVSLGRSLGRALGTNQVIKGFGPLSDGSFFSLQGQGLKNFERWKGDNKLVAGPEVQEVKTGEPIVAQAYHGTTNEFYEFDSSVKGNIDGHLGRINYFTTDYQDASMNYQADGPDITGRIDILAERIEDEMAETFGVSDEASFTSTGTEGGLVDTNLITEILDHFNSPLSLDDYIEDGYENINIANFARTISKSLIEGGTEQVLDLYIKLNNPIVLGNRSTWFDTLDIAEEDITEAAEEVAEEYEISVDEAKEDYYIEVQDRAIENTGYENKVLEALQESLVQNGYSADKASEVFADNYYDLEIDLNQLEKDLRKAELYENDEGELAVSQVISDFFKNLGYDGIILTDVDQRFRNMGLSRTTSHIHVFDEFNNQIKLSDGSNVSFDPNSRDIRFSRQDGTSPVNQLWVSNALDGLNKMDDNPRQPNQWVKELIKNGGRGTAQQLDWIGLEDYLKEWKKENKAKSIPKEVVEQYIVDNDIRIEEVSKGGRNKKSFDEVFTLEDKGDTFYYEHENAGMGDNPAYEAFEEDGVWYVESEFTGEPFEDFDSKEDAIKAIKESYEKLDEGVVAEANTRYSDLTLRGGENYREVLLMLSNNKKSDQKYYKKEHFDEANILAHLRINERTLPNGERVLFIEEVQSDWAQEGKKKGFNVNYKYTKDSVKSIKETKKESKNKYIIKFKDGSEYLIYSASKKEAIKEAVKNANYNNSAFIPSMPYKKTDQWVGMAMRRAMQMAAREGFDRVAWVTGEQSADRYDLSKQVEYIDKKTGLSGDTYVDISTQTGLINLRLDDNEVVKEQYGTQTGDSFVGKPLDDVIGKELAQKVLDGESGQRFEGEDLKVGGEGMKAFYNSILPKVAGKEAKRFDKKAKVEVVDFRGKGESKTMSQEYNDWLNENNLPQESADDLLYGPNRDNLTTEQKEYLEDFIENWDNSDGAKPSGVASKQLSIPITDKMRGILRVGIPKFSRQGQPTREEVTINNINQTPKAQDKLVSLLDTLPYEPERIVKAFGKQNDLAFTQQQVDLILDIAEARRQEIKEQNEKQEQKEKENQQPMEGISFKDDLDPDVKEALDDSGKKEKDLTRYIRRALRSRLIPKALKLRLFRNPDKLTKRSLELEQIEQLANAYLADVNTYEEYVERLEELRIPYDKEIANEETLWGLTVLHRLSVKFTQLNTSDGLDRAADIQEIISDHLSRAGANLGAASPQMLPDSQVEFIAISEMVRVHEQLKKEVQDPLNKDEKIIPKERIEQIRREIQEEYEGIIEGLRGELLKARAKRASQAPEVKVMPRQKVRVRKAKGKLRKKANQHLKKGMDLLKRNRNQDVRFSKQGTTPENANIDSLSEVSQQDTTALIEIALSTLFSSNGNISEARSLFTQLLKESGERSRIYTLFGRKDVFDVIVKSDAFHELSKDTLREIAIENFKAAIGQFDASVDSKTGTLKNKDVVDKTVEEITNAVNAKKNARLTYIDKLPEQISEKAQKLLDEAKKRAEKIVENYKTDESLEKGQAETELQRVQDELQVALDDAGEPIIAPNYNLATYTKPQNGDMISVKGKTFRYNGSNWMNTKTERGATTQQLGQIMSQFNSSFISSSKINEVRKGISEGTISDSNLLLAWKSFKSRISVLPDAKQREQLNEFEEIIYNTFGLDITGNVETRIRVKFNTDLADTTLNEIVDQFYLEAKGTDLPKVLMERLGMSEAQANNLAEDIKKVIAEQSRPKVKKIINKFVKSRKSAASALDLALSGMLTMEDFKLAFGKEYDFSILDKKKVEEFKQLIKAYQTAELKVDEKKAAGNLQQFLLDNKNEHYIVKVKDFVVSLIYAAYLNGVKPFVTAAVGGGILVFGEMPPGLFKTVLNGNPKVFLAAIKYGFQGLITKGTRESVHIFKTGDSSRIYMNDPMNTRRKNYAQKLTIDNYNKFLAETKAEFSAEFPARVAALMFWSIPSLLYRLSSLVMVGDALVRSFATDYNMAMKYYFDVISEGSQPTKELLETIHEKLGYDPRVSQEVIDNIINSELGNMEFESPKQKQEYIKNRTHEILMDKRRIAPIVEAEMAELDFGKGVMGKLRAKRYETRRKTELRSEFQDDNLASRASYLSKIYALMQTPEGILGKYANGISSFLNQGSNRKNTTGWALIASGIAQFLVTVHFPFVLKVGVNATNKALSYGGYNAIIKPFVHQIYKRLNVKTENKEDLKRFDPNYILISESGRSDDVIYRERDAQERWNYRAESFIGAITTVLMSSLIFDLEEDEDGEWVLLLDEDSPIRTTGLGTGSYAKDKSVDDGYESRAIQIKWDGKYRTIFNWDRHPIGGAFAPLGYVHDKLYFNEGLKLSGFEPVKIIGSSLFSGMIYTLFSNVTEDAQNLVEKGLTLLRTLDLTQKDDRQEAWDKLSKDLLIAGTTTEPAGNVLTGGAFTKWLNDMYAGMEGDALYQGESLWTKEFSRRGNLMDMFNIDHALEKRRNNQFGSPMIPEIGVFSDIGVADYAVFGESTKQPTELEKAVKENPKLQYAGYYSPKVLSGVTAKDEMLSMDIVNDITHNQSSVWADMFVRNDGVVKEAYESISIEDTTFERPKIHDVQESFITSLRTHATSEAKAQAILNALDDVGHDYGGLSDFTTQTETIVGIELGYPLERLNFQKVKQYMLEQGIAFDRNGELVEN